MRRTKIKISVISITYESICDKANDKVFPVFNLQSTTLRRPMGTAGITPPFLTSALDGG
jgi:hypothetical protein